SAMLAKRVITAVVAVAILVVLVFLAPASVWSLFMLAVALVGCWEWSRLCGLKGGGRSAFLALSVVAAVLLWLFYVGGAPAAFTRLALAAFAIAAIFWVAVAPFWIARHMHPSPPVSAIAGWLVLWPTWIAFVVLRDAGPW